MPEECLFLTPDLTIERSWTSSTVYFCVNLLIIFGFLFIDRCFFKWDVFFHAFLYAMLCFLFLSCRHEFVLH